MIKHHQPPSTSVPFIKRCALLLINSAYRLLQERLHDARLSFVSGHASLSAYSMTYTVLYLQRGMGSKDFRLVKPLIQVLQVRKECKNFNLLDSNEQKQIMGIE